MTNPRRRRFIAYFDGPLKGSRDLLMKRTGLTKGRVSQLFDDTKPFGELAARNIAEKLGLAPDFFEQDAPGAPKAPSDVPNADLRGLHISDSEWAMLQDFKLLPDDDQERMRLDAKAKADAIRHGVEQELARLGIRRPVSDAVVEANFPPPPSRGKK